MRLGYPAQDRVADGVAVRVVDRLEMVDVDECHTKGPLVARCAFDLGEQRREERLSIGDAGQPVDGRAIVCVGERGGDEVDRGTEAGFESAATRRHGDGVVAGGDPLGGLDQPPESQAHHDPGQRRSQGDPDRHGRDPHNGWTRTDVDPRRRELRARQEEDPDRDRSHERQDPQQAHHTARLR